MDTYLLGDSPLTSSSTERSIDSSDRICLPPSINSVLLHEQEETTYQDNNPLTINKSHVVSSSHIHHQKVQKPIHNKVINTAIHDMFTRPPQPTIMHTTPELDVVEYENSYRFYLDLPSIKKESLKISFQKRYLIIEGTRVTHYDGCKSVLFRRRKSGSFYHRIPYNPEIMDVAHAIATYTNGELCITMNKIHS